jgi:hypothetical protein
VVAKVEKPGDSPRPLDIWSALDSWPRPALLYVVTVPVDLDISTHAPLVFTRTARYTPIPASSGGPDVRTRIGGVVADRKGQPVAGARVSVAGRAHPGVITDAVGAFTLSDVPAAGTLTLQIDRDDAKPTLVKITVPSMSHTLVIT